jgi:hypothetical protein
MTTPGQPCTPAEALRAAADFLESCGQPDGVAVACRAGSIRVHISQPYDDAGARQEIVTRLAGLIGGTVRQDDHRDYPAAELRADGAVGGLRAAVVTQLDVRTNSPRSGEGRPFAQAPSGRVIAVPGKKLPEGWRWVTELDPEPQREARRNQPAATAAALAARDCPPLTSAALKAARAQPAARQPASTRAVRLRPGPGGS